MGSSSQTLDLNYCLGYSISPLEEQVIQHVQNLRTLGWRAGLGVGADQEFSDVVRVGCCVGGQIGCVAAMNLDEAPYATQDQVIDAVRRMLQGDEQLGEGMAEGAGGDQLGERFAVGAQPSASQCGGCLGGCLAY